jgi:hypothetical protein
MDGVSGDTVSEEDLFQWVTNNSYEFDDDSDPFAEDSDD